MKRILKTYPLTLLVLAAIVFLSLFNPPQTGIDNITNIDKIAHLCMYGGLELVIWTEYLRHHSELDYRKLILLAILAPILFSGAMELAQMYLTDNRSGEWSDFAANSCGVVTGAVIGFLVLKRIVRRR